MDVASAATSSRWSDSVAVALLVADRLGAVYGARLSRSADRRRRKLAGRRGAREMLATGDWIVPRQQGQVFPERPPMTMWLMAVAGWLRGDVDLVAIRLPSVIAVVLTSLLIYGYARALVFPDSPRSSPRSSTPRWARCCKSAGMGESEAVFALFVSASLLAVAPRLHARLAAAGDVVDRLRLRRARCAREGSASAGLLRRDHRRVPRCAAATGGTCSVGNTRSASPSSSRSSPPGRFRSTWRPIWHAVTATWAGLAADRVHLGRPRQALRHVPARNVRLPAALVADLGRARQPRNARPARRPVAARVVPGDRDRRRLSDGLDRRRRRRPILHAALSARGRAHRPRDRTLLARRRRPLSASRLAPVPAALARR